MKLNWTRFKLGSIRYFVYPRTYAITSFVCKQFRDCVNYLILFTAYMFTFAIHWLSNFIRYVLSNFAQFSLSYYIILYCIPSPIQLCQYSIFHWTCHRLGRSLARPTECMKPPLRKLRIWTKVYSPSATTMQTKTARIYNSFMFTSVSGKCEENNVQ